MSCQGWSNPVIVSLCCHPEPVEGWGYHSLVILLICSSGYSLQAISIDPKIRFGKPCITLTRITVSDILQWLASGMDFSEILQDYPALKEDHIRAALTFAANRESMIKIIAA